MNKYKTPYIDIWFMLTPRQQRKLCKLGYVPTWRMIGISLNTMRKVTRSKKILAAVVEMNRSILKVA